MSAPWPPEQDALVRHLAGTVTPAVIARRVSAVGPHRSEDALHAWASRTRLSIRPKRRQARTPDHRRHDWSAGEDAMLRRLVGRMPPAGITDALNGRFFTSRRAWSIRNRALDLGLSLRRTDGIRMADMVATFRIHNRRIVAFVDAGVLRAAHRGSGRRGSDWVFTPADIEAWMRNHPWLIDWRRVAPGRWRDLARAVSLRDPYLTVREAAARTGVRPGMVQKWIRQGRLPAISGSAHGLTRSAGFRIALRDLDRIDQLIAETFGSHREAVA